MRKSFVGALWALSSAVAACTGSGAGTTGDDEATTAGAAMVEGSASATPTLAIGRYQFETAGVGATMDIQSIEFSPACPTGLVTFDLYTLRKWRRESVSIIGAHAELGPTVLPLPWFGPCSGTAQPCRIQPTGQIAGNRQAL
jgi:hypothetical protein